MTPASATRVLILSASAGTGHTRAAEALVKAFQAYPGVGRVEHWDVLTYMTALFRTLYSRVYLQLMTRAPAVLGMAYRATDRPGERTFAQTFETWNAGPLREALRAYAPDVIVATHFTPPNLLAALHERHPGDGFPAPVTVVTDLDCHAMWLTSRYAGYCVWLEETRAYLERLGIPAERITCTGIPIDPAFRTPRDRGEARRALGLAAERPTILVSAGGFGAGLAEAVVRQLLTLGTPAQIVAVAGRSVAVKGALDRLAAAGGGGGGESRLTVVGYTTQMDVYMAAADLLVSKPGGMTTAEAMARGLPLCIVQPIPGQEERNADHLLEAGTAIRGNNVPALGWKVDRLLASPGRLEAMRAAALALGRPNAGEEIVEASMGPFRREG